MTRLVIGEHSTKPGIAIVEIFHPHLGFIGAIYPTAVGVRIISKYFEPGRDLVAIDPTDPPELEVLIV